MSEEQLYEDLALLGVFFVGLWLASWMCTLLKLSPIVGQILFGILMGPNGLDLVPLFDGFGEFDTDCGENDTGAPDPTDTTDTTDSTGFDVPGQERLENYLIILGQLGVTFLIFESGLHVDFNILKKVGPSAFLVAVLGTTFSIAFAMGLSELLDFGAYPEGLAIGAVIAPTSVGIALKLLVDANVLDSVFGQTIVTAAFTDDIFSLITLAVLIELAAGDFSIVSVIKPLGSASAFILVGFGAALFVMPKIMPPVFKFILKHAGQTARDRLHLGFIFLLMAGFAYIGTLIGSHLLGAFLTGIAVSRVPRTDVVWSKHLTQVNEWLLALFFGATVAFAVPVEQMFDFEVFWKGALLGLLTILAKILSGAPLKHRWVIGWAMVGRGEFSFIVGETLERTEWQGTGEPFLTVKGFGVAVWALMIAIFVAPIAFGVVLARKLKKANTPVPVTTVQEDSKGPGNQPSQGGDLSLQVPNLSERHSTLSQRFSALLFRDKKGTPRSPWKITIATPYQEGLLADVMSILQELDIQLVSLHNETSAFLSIITIDALITDPLAPTSVRGRGELSVGRMSDQTYKFTDEYFAFDIGRYTERLIKRIKNSLNDNAEIKLEKSPETAVRRVSSTLANSTVALERRETGVSVGKKGRMSRQVPASQLLEVDKDEPKLSEMTL